MLLYKIGQDLLDIQYVVKQYIISEDEGKQTILLLQELFTSWQVKFHQ